MAWSLINSLQAGSSGGGTFTSGSQSTTGATFLLTIVASFQSATEPTLSDSAGNTWVAHTAQSTGGATPGRLRIWWVDNNTPNTSASHTVTITGAGSFGAVAFAAWSGSGSNPDDQFATVSGTSASPSAAAITPSQNGSLVIACLSHTAGTSPSFAIDSGLTIIQSRNYSSGNSFPVVLAWIEQTTAASIDPTWTLGNSQQFAAQVASFKPPGGAPQPFNAMLIQP